MNSLNAYRSPLRWLFAVSALSLGLTAEHALADEPADTRGMKVSFADLDLSKEAGAKVLYRRIQNAATSVCGRVDSREIARYRLYRQCYDDAIEAALKEVNSSSLYAVHNPQGQGSGTGLAAGRSGARAATMQ